MYEIPKKNVGEKRIEFNIEKQILNLSEQVATPEQIECGVVPLPESIRDEILELMYFESIPKKAEIQRRARLIAELVNDEFVNIDGEIKVMIGGAPFLMSVLEYELRMKNFKPVYSFREVVTDEEGQYVMKHVGWVDV